MTTSRQNIYDRGAYEGDALIHGDNGLARAIAGRAQHKRAYVGGLVMLGDPLVVGNGAGFTIVAGVHTFAAPFVQLCPQAEQFTLMAAYEGTATQNAPSFLAMRFMLNNEFATSWLQPCPLRAYQLNAVAGAVLSSIYSSPVIGTWTLPFDQILFALSPGATLNLSIQGIYATGAARFTAVASQNT